MDWPVATVLITVVSTICVAIIKVAPKRMNGNGNGLDSRESGMVLARLTEIERRLGVIEGKVGCNPS